VQVPKQTVMYTYSYMYVMSISKANHIPLPKHTLAIAMCSLSFKYSLPIYCIVIAYSYTSISYITLVQWLLLFSFLSFCFSLLCLQQRKDFLYTLLAFSIPVTTSSGITE